MKKHVFTDNQQWAKLKNGIMSLAKTEVLSRFEQVLAQVKTDGTLLTEADTQMQIQTQNFLEKNWPMYAFLGEESALSEQEKAMKSTDGCWILDPVDGTSNFAIGIPVYSVSLALMIEGEIVAGLVYDPSRDEMFAARKGVGAELNSMPLIAQTAKTALSQCSSIVDFKRLEPVLATRLAVQPPYYSQRSFGSVALDWCWIAAGRGQVYLHGAQNIWDYAAGWLILQEAGGQSSTLDKECVVVARVEKRSAVAATTTALFKEWVSFLKA